LASGKKKKEAKLGDGQMRGRSTEKREPEDTPPIYALFMLISALSLYNIH
jgi:hypothetical protein